jgi:hypothetical protein
MIMMFMSLVFSSSKCGAVVALANATIMVTDNVEMYLYYQVPIVLMLAFSANRVFSASETVIAPPTTSFTEPTIEEGASYPIGPSLRGPL